MIHVRPPIPQLRTQLQAMKARLESLTRLYPFKGAAAGPGVAQAKEQIPILCRNLDDAIRALDTGIAPDGGRITPGHVGDGLLRMVHDVDRPQWYGVMAVLLSPEGVAELRRSIREFGQIAVDLGLS